MSGSLRTQVGQVARRSVIRTLRQPAQIVPAMVFPLVLLAVNASGLKPATEIPGFPTSSYISFVLGFTFIQGAMFAVMNAGTDLAGDVQTGFLNRLALTPLRGWTLLTGLLAGAVTLGLMQAALFLAVGLAAGAEFSAGLGGVPVLFGLSMLVTLGFGALGLFVGLRRGSGEGVQAVFPAMFVFLFLSSAFLPRNLIETDWFREVATYNPVSYLIEAMRSLFLSGWDAQALELGFGIAAAFALVAMAAASAALRSRLVRT